MEWFFDEPHRAKALLAAIIVGVAAVGVWLGRRRLLITIPCVLVFLLLAAVVIPSVFPVHKAASIRMVCIANLRAIADAKAQWARENSRQPTDTPTDADLFGETKPLPSKPQCPQRGTYITGAVEDNPACSFAHKGHRL